MDDANVTFPNPSGCNTLDIYGKVINGNIKFRTLFNPLRKAFNPNDLFFIN